MMQSVFASGEPQAVRPLAFNESEVLEYCYDNVITSRYKMLKNQTLLNLRESLPVILLTIVLSGCSNYPTKEAKQALYQAVLNAPCIIKG
jgi:hypothetical protein